jgi:hypothetical protein
LYRDYSYTANGLAFAFIKAAVEGGIEVAIPEFESSPTYNGIGPYRDLQVNALAGLYVRSSSGARLLITNTGNQRIILQHTFNGVRVIEYGGDKCTELRTSKIFDLKDLPVREVKGNQVEIKPFSVTLISAILSGSVE